MAVANNALAASRKDKTGVQGKERVEFDLDGLQDQLACPLRRTSVSGSSISSFCRSETTLFSFMA
jgi:hypothetical protein